MADSLQMICIGRISALYVLGGNMATGSVPYLAPCALASGPLIRTDREREKSSETLARDGLEVSA
jgi:hypothetical protein